MKISYCWLESICREDVPMSSQPFQSNFSGSMLCPEKIEPVPLKQYARGGVPASPLHVPLSGPGSEERELKLSLAFALLKGQLIHQLEIQLCVPIYQRQRQHQPCSYQSFAAIPTHRSFSIIIY